MRLKEKVAIITGSGSGIGRACVELFAREGARVVIGEIDEASGLAVQEEVRRQGGTCVFVRTDVSQPDDVKRMVDTAITEYGRLDILYNNAGGSTMQDGPVTTTSHEEFWRKMNVDLFGTWLGCQYAIPHMIAAGGGAVINASSMYGLVGTPNRGCLHRGQGRHHGTDPFNGC